MGQVCHVICGPQYEMCVQSTCTKISRWQTVSIEDCSKYGMLGRLTSHISTELMALFYLGGPCVESRVTFQDPIKMSNQVSKMIY